jgi:uncharacterized protein YjiS (DUF1127 family)
MIVLLSTLPQLPAQRPSGFSGLIHDAKTALHSFLRRKKTIARLQALDDRSLADVGIQRDEIETVVSEIEALVRANRRANPLGRQNPLGAPSRI